MTTARTLRIESPGLQTTVQDQGRWGMQSYGVPVAGPMDPYAHRTANALVGNLADAATLEVTLVGPEITFAGAHVVAVTGARFDLALDGWAPPQNHGFEVRAGARLRFGARRRGARAYVAISGGIDVIPVFGSRSTSLSSRMGGVDGRALLRGDVLPIGSRTAAPPGAAWEDERLVPDGHAEVRVLPGPHADRFAASALDTLQAGRYRVTTDSSRMAFRLEGRPIAHDAGADIISDVTPLGAIQVPASGLPILLMADRQTTGGYAIIATVISADIGLAGQLGPGDTLQFRVCSRHEAAAALIERERRLLRLCGSGDAGAGR